MKQMMPVTEKRELDLFIPLASEVLPLVRIARFSVDDEPKYGVV